MTCLRVQNERSDKGSQESGFLMCTDAPGEAVSAPRHSHCAQHINLTLHLTLMCILHWSVSFRGFPSCCFSCVCALRSSPRPGRPSTGMSRPCNPEQANEEAKVSFSLHISCPCFVRCCLDSVVMSLLKFRMHDSAACSEVNVLHRQLRAWQG